VLLSLGPTLDAIVVMAAALAVAPALGNYIARVFQNRPAFGDALFLPVESMIYRLLGVTPREGMRFRDYLLGLLFVNAAVIVWIIVVSWAQWGLFPARPGSTPMTWDLLFHTAASFATNTDFTHFSAETSYTMWGELLAFMLPFFFSVATGLVVAAAIGRGFVRRDGTLGNVYVDYVRSITRILLPLAVLAAIVYLALGVPATITDYVTAHPPGAANYPIVLGPVAPWQAIEILGNNGGGWYGANALSPLATPNSFVTLFGIFLMMLLPFAILFTFGYMARRPTESYPYVGTAIAVFLIALILFGYFEASGNLLAAQFRFAYPEDASFQLVSVYTNTGATNLNIGLLTPVAQLVLLFGMFTQSTPGGTGTGFGTLFINVIIAVFIAGLMVGRTPEYLGKKIDLGQVRWSAFVLIIHPAIILIPTAITYVGGFVTFPSAASGGFCGGAICSQAHNFTTLLYEFTSEAANNGSNMSQINDATPYMNVVGGIVMLLGRYLPIIGMLAVAAGFAGRDEIPPGPGTLTTRGLTFTLYLTLILILVTALLFLPVMALGPLSQIGG
jgi:potassium-transporting ATPase potassium-binding subunit